MTEWLTWEHLYSNECAVKLVALVWFNLEKKMSKEVGNEVFVVSSNNEIQVPSKNTKF